MASAVLIRICPRCKHRSKTANGLSEEQATKLAHEHTGFHLCDGCKAYRWFTPQDMELLSPEEAQAFDEGPAIYHL